MESWLLNSSQTPPKVSTQIQPCPSPPRILMAQTSEGVEGIHPSSLTWRGNPSPRVRLYTLNGVSPLCASAHHGDNTPNPR